MTYCSRFAERGWVYDDGTLSIEAHKWLEQGYDEHCAGAEAVPEGELAKPATTVPCEELGEDPVIECALLHHVRRSEARDYVQELQRRQRNVECDDGTPLDELGVPSTSEPTASAPRSAASRSAAIPTPPPIAVHDVEIPSVFSRPQTAAERAAASSRDVTEDLSSLANDDANVPEEWKPGRARGDVRILLSGAGESDRFIYAFTTEKNRLCLGLTDFTSGCLAVVPAHQPVTVTVGDPDLDGDGEPPIVWGYAKSEVVAIDVVVAGKRFRAKLGANAYFFQLPHARTPTESIEALEVHGTGGDVDVVPVVYGPTLFAP